MNTDEPQAPYITEHEADTHITAAVRYLDKANSNLWMAGYHAWQVWRTYQEYAIKEIADQAKKDKSSIENYCHAYDLYNDLKTIATRTELFRIRHAVTISHFWRAWSLRRTYPKADNFRCLASLGQAALHGWSADEMVKEALRSMNISAPPAKPETVLRGLVGYAETILANLAQYEQRHPRLIELAREILNELQGAGDAQTKEC